MCVAALLKTEVSIMWHVCVWQRDLAEVSVDEWNNLPEVGDARNRKQRVGRTEK